MKGIIPVFFFFALLVFDCAGFQERYRSTEQTRLENIDSLNLPGSLSESFARELSAHLNPQTDRRSNCPDFQSCLQSARNQQFYLRQIYDLNTAINLWSPADGERELALARVMRARATLEEANGRPIDPQHNETSASFMILVEQSQEYLQRACIDVIVDTSNGLATGVLHAQERLQARRLRAEALYINGQYNAALQDMDRILNQSNAGEYHRTRYFRAMIYLSEYADDRERLGSARDDLDLALESFESELYYLARGHIERKLGNHRQARSDYRKAAGLGSDEAIDALERYYDL